MGRLQGQAAAVEQDALVQLISLYKALGRGWEEAENVRAAAPLGAGSPTR